MSGWRESLPVWGPAWAAIADPVDGAGNGAATQPMLLAWPSDEAAAFAATLVPGNRLTIVTDDPAAAAAFAASHGLQPAISLTVLSAVTNDLDLLPELPADAYLAEAPMENYDAVEVALFDRPVADGRMKLADGLAVLAGLRVDDGHDELLGVLEQAMAAAMGEEAFVHGADVLYLVAGEAQADRFAAVDGWTKVAEILNFSK